MKKFILILLFSVLISSVPKIQKKSVINEKSLDLQVREAYLEGLGIRKR